MIQKKESPVDLMEYSLHKKMRAIGMECLYDRNGNVRMWIRISPKTKNKLFSKPKLRLTEV